MLDEFYKELDTTERTEENMTALIGKYVELGLTYDEVSEALKNMNNESEKSKDITVDYSKILDEKASVAVDDFAHAIISVPFNEFRNELHQTIEAGDTFGERVGKTIANLVVDFTLLITKIALMKSLLAATGGGADIGQFLMRFFGAKKGGEVGVSVLKYARGGPLPGKPGGDVNLGLFKRHEWLVPPERVTEKTRPLLEAITFGKTQRYANGGEIGGDGVKLGKDIQIVNVITEDMIMGVVDKNKDVVLNYVGRDILSGGVTRRIIRRAT
ncbi:MAG: hypothetical protein ACTSR3_19015 [Candidatus Helarchaeota archaeon]